MRGLRLAGVLWLIAGISAAGIAFFVTDVPTLTVFIVGAVAGVLQGLGMLLRPSTALASWSLLLGVAWLIGFGVVIIGNLSAPIEELLSVVWVLAFGVGAAVAAYSRHPNASYS